MPHGSTRADLDIFMHISCLFGSLELCDQLPIALVAVDMCAGRLQGFVPKALVMAGEIAGARSTGVAFR